MIDKLSLKILKVEIEGAVNFIEIRKSEEEDYYNPIDEYGRNLALDILKGKRKGLVNVLDELENL